MDVENVWSPRDREVREDILRGRGETPVGKDQLTAGSSPNSLHAVQHTNNEHPCIVWLDNTFSSSLVLQPYKGILLAKRQPSQYIRAVRYASLGGRKMANAMSHISTPSDSATVPHFEETYKGRCQQMVPRSCHRFSPFHLRNMERGRLP